MAWPEEGRPPRRIMPKLDVIIEGFYFVWAMEDDSYSWREGELGNAEPPPEMLEVVERETLGSGAALMSPDEADEAMWSDGDAGTRHDALLRMTYDWVQEHPGMGISELCQTFEDWFLSIYEERIDAERLRVLLEWDVDDERGELYRAMTGAQKKAPPSDDVIAKAAAKLKERGLRPSVSAMSRSIGKAETHGRVASEFEDIVLDELIREDLPDIDWIVPDLIPRGNLIGLTGPSGGGKTRWLSALSCCLAARAMPLIGMTASAEPAKVLYVANEERSMDVRRRLKAFATLNGLSTDLPITVRGKDNGQLRLAGPDGMLQDVVDGLVEVVNARGIDVVLFDPFVTLGSIDENKSGNEGVQPVIDALMQIANRTGAAVLFSHHPPKGERGAPEDQYRGDPTAFRGSGAIYSPLDIAITLSPYLPPACHAAKEGKENRRKLRQAISNRAVDKYIVVDSAKERESQGFKPVFFRMQGQEVRPGGMPIGALRMTDERTARQDLEAAIAGADFDEDLYKAKRWAKVLIEAFGEGRHKLTIRQLAATMDAAKPEHWRVLKGKARVDQGSGKDLVVALSSGVVTGGVYCQLLTDESQSELLLVIEEMV